MTETLIERLIRHEGFRSVPYTDTTGNLTIGFGHKLTSTQAVQYADGISNIDALNLLHADISHCIDECEENLSCYEGLDDVRADVLTEMVFQLGIAGVQKFKNMLTAITAQDWKGAHDAMLDSQWYLQTPKRCAELAGIMLTGQLPS